MLEVIIENGKVKVKSEYNTEFIKKARAAQGKWSSPYWVFPEENEEIVRDILLDVYGEDGRPCETVTVDLNLDEYEYGQNIMLGSILVASRTGRDFPVKLSGNAIVIKGEFENSGGSANFPRVTHEEGTVVRVKNVPLKIYERAKDLKGLTLIKDTEKSKKEKLMKEKGALLARLKEIDIELEKLN